YEGAFRAVLENSPAREAFQALTAEPRKYGFHATLKAPFALPDGATRKALADAVAQFCRARRPIELPPFEVTRLADFLALVPSAREGRVNELAADCVREFEAFRAPLAAAELDRRRRTGLSPRQERYLEEWGYPYVLAEYRFHLTLTGSLERAPPHQVTALVVAAREALAALDAAPLRVDAVCLFEQPEPATPFRLVRRFLFSSRRKGA
ncbi:MAG: DUF1045 domain-containing protein, partial [Burkholderiales bacterium]